MGYSRDEVKAIIERAIDAQSTRSDDVSHDELLSIGRELGLSGDALEAAAKGVRESRALDAARAEVRRRERAGFIAHLIPYVLVNLGLVITWFATGSPPWFLASLIGWGIGLAFHAQSAFWPDEKRRDRKVQRHIEHQRRRAERQAQREAFDKVKRELGAGVAQAITSVADAVSAAAKQSRDERSHVRVTHDAPTSNAAVEPRENEAPSHEARDAKRARHG